MAARWLSALVGASITRPAVTAALGLMLAVLGLAWSFRTLTFQSSNLELLPATASYAARYREYLRDFGELNDIVLAVQAPAPDEAVRYVTRLVTELRGGPIDGSRLTYRLDPTSLEGRALLYLPLERLVELRRQLVDYEELIDGYAAQPTLARLLDAVNDRLGQAFVSRFLDLGLETTVAGDARFLETVLEQITARLAGEVAPYRSPWDRLPGATGPGGQVRYFFSKDARYLFVFVETRGQRGARPDHRPTVEALRAAVATLRTEFPAVEAGVTGTPAISSDEMATAFADSRTAGIVALAATLALLLAAFRAVAAPLLMLLSLGASLAWSLGIIALTLGHLNIFSVMFISIVSGIGIDYGIYVLFRVREEVGLGAAPTEALGRAVRLSGPGVVVSALAAASAFFVLMLTGFRGIREFGFVSGVAILMACLAMLTLFPALLVLLGRRRARALARAEPATLWRVPVAPRWIITGAGVLSALALVAATRVGFDDNLLRLQADGVESVRWEKRMLAEAGRSALSALATAETLDELRQKTEAFARLPSVARVDSILAVLPDRQSDKLPLIHSLGSTLAPLRVAAPPAFAAAELRGPVESLGRRLTMAVREAPAPPPELQRLQRLAERLGGALDDPLAPAAEAALGTLQRELAQDFAQRVHRLQANLETHTVDVEDVPAALSRRHVGVSGRFLMRIQPAIDVWPHAGATRFVAELRTVDPEVTGAPVITYESIRLMKRGYVEGTVYAVVVVLGLTALMFRNARDVLAAALPLTLGLGWTLGVMPLAGLSFDLGNVWALPLLLGIAAEYGVALVMRVREAGTASLPAVPRGTVLAILLNGLTTIAGFGSLLVAHHRGIFGLGLLLTIGTAASLVAALVVLPALYGLIRPPSAPGAEQSGRPRRRAPAP